MAKRTINVYRSYSFVDKDPVIDRLRGIVTDSKQSYRTIHENSGVSETTLYQWFNGRTRRPQFATVMAVARSLGFDVSFVREEVTAKAKIVVFKKRAA